jgi:uncharacterized repeat protein (TIGR02543 family)
LSKPGYTFNGWNTAADGTGTTYAAGATVTLAADVTLYVLWAVSTEATTAESLASLQRIFNATVSVMESTIEDLGA